VVLIEIILALGQAQQFVALWQHPRGKYIQVSLPKLNYFSSSSLSLHFLAGQFHFDDC